MAFALILFFLTINVASSILNGLEVLPTPTSPYAEPSAISTDFLMVPVSLAFLGLGVLGAILTKNPYVTVAALIIFAFDRLLPFGSWAITGFPTYLGVLGVPALIVTGLQMLFYFVWFIAIMELATGRTAT